LTFSCFAQNMTSESGYEIVHSTINAGGDDDQVSTSADYRLFDSLGASLNDIRFESENYALGIGTGYTFMAEVPTVSYFQTDDATMEALCGDGGCYDRARFELNANGNPSGTLYLVEISSDDWTTVQYIDGPTRQVVPEKDINDYLSETSWETEGTNIAGLKAGTEYHIRLRALNGDFTESSPSTDASATTVYPYVYLAVNISGDTWQDTDPPHTIDMGKISQSISTAPDYVWIDLGTNAVSGATVNVFDQHSGLYHSESASTIESLDENLATASDGYGLRVNTATFLPVSPQPGYLRAQSRFIDPSGTDVVGGINTSSAVILCSISDAGENCDSGTGHPLVGGRGAIWIKAKSGAAQASGEYQDVITFSSIGTF
ncbi:MAG: fibronectin type III domain-containing protein, partial [Candidatus Dojkabacteria bacterium]|nr:fibronectin type III domain-containing protein [Candidatus Dojkabacteria bacterium]